MLIDDEQIIKVGLYDTSFRILFHFKQDRSNSK